ncbi:MAG: DNA repair protein RecN [Rhodospirillaceae bacterium]|nr:DNA repair protein RecN [Rhodospirillaceae bacterium]
MLARLSIRDVVLIDQLDLALEGGFSALTGETGAGKSILLDALGLALGARGDAKLVRHGAAQAVVTAAFDLADSHPVRALLRDRGLDGEGPIIIRRTVGADGRGRAFVNDQPATVALLREIGDGLVEIQGQAEQHGLAVPATHRPALDAFGGIDTAAIEAAHADWQAALAARDAHAAMARQAATDEEYLRHALTELEALDPKPGEEETLQAERQLLMNRERLVEALNGAMSEISGSKPVEAALRGARRQLDRIAAKVGGALDPVLAALDRAAIEVGEALRLLDAVGNSVESDSARLQTVDDRLFALRDLARKHRIEVGGLPALRQEIAAKLAAITDSSAERGRLEKRAAEARTAYTVTAEAVSRARKAAAAALDKAIMRELPPLKLDKARFATRIEPLPESEWGAAGCDRVAFEVATNPGAPLGAIGRIASGGELARFMLALKVVLARTGSAPTLVFDEVDSGIGGATAAAVGERLARLGRDVQVLVVTHSPQVAARAAHHFRVEKQVKGAAKTATRVEALSAAKRREEIARMLAGAAVTDEARSAADALMAGGKA